MSRRIEIIGVLVVLAAAAFLRLLWLDAIPVGWHADEALMGIMASEVYRGAQRPIFFTGFLGQEPLYIYLSAGVMWLMNGNLDILPLRITSALLGVATVGITYLMGREMFGRRIGLIAAALLGVSFYQLIFGRTGYRVITQPLLEALTVYLLWRAIKRDSAAYYVAAGAALGATLYTYLGARIFPAVPVLFGIWWVLARGRPSLGSLRSPIIFAIAAAAVAAPLLLFFATHPGTFSARIDQVLVAQQASATKSLVVALGENVFKLLRIFTIQGDTLWRFNIDGRPIFVGIVGFLFYAGAFVVLRGFSRRRPAETMVLVWLGLMAAPSFLSEDVGGYSPRSMGLVPALYLLPALGFVGVWDWLAPRIASIRGLGVARLGAVVIAVILLVDGVTTYRDYFTIWAGHFGSQYQNMDDIVAEARFLDREANPDQEDIYVSTDLYQRSIIAHLAPRVYPNVRWFDGRSVLVLSQDRARDSVYVFPYSAWPPDVESLLPGENVAQRGYFGDGTLKMIAYRFTPAQMEATTAKILSDRTLTRTTANLSDEVELLGYRLDRRVERGGALKAIAVWRILRDAPSADYVSFAHLLDSKAVMWGQYDTPAYPTASWRAGDIIMVAYTLPVGQPVPAGKYTLGLGWYDAGTLERLALKGSATRQDTLPLDAIKVAAPPAPAQPATTPMRRSLAEGIEFTGFDLQRDGGDSTLRAVLHWQAGATPKRDLTVFVQLLNPEGRLVAQSDSQPSAGRFPTSFWEPGEQILDEHELKPGAGLPAGRYRLIAGMYDLADGKRLPVAGGGDHIVLTEIEIGR